MATVLVADGAEGLAVMLGGLLEAAAADPAKAKVLDAMAGSVTIEVPDAEVSVGLRFGNGVCRVSAQGIPGSTLRIEMASDTLLAFSTIPLLYGMPSALTPEGRAFTKQVLTRQVRIGGLLRHPRLVTQLNTVLNVA